LRKHPAQAREVADAFGWVAIATLMPKRLGHEPEVAEVGDLFNEVLRTSTKDVRAVMLKVLRALTAPDPAHPGLKRGSLRRTKTGAGSRSPKVG
jgi:hypothetical protein